MLENMELLLERDFKIDLAMEKAQQLNTTSKTYKRHATKVNQRMAKRNFYMKLILFLLGLLCGAFILIGGLILFKLIPV